MQPLLALFALLALNLGIARAQTPLPTPDPAARISIGDATVIEGNTTYREVAFPVTLSKSLPFDVSTKYSTKDITAKSTGDYTPQVFNRVIIKAGQTATKIIVRVTSDKIEEADESFLVQLARPTSVIIGDADGIGTVKDDDYAGKISVSDVSTAEGNSGTKIARTLVSLSSAPLHGIALNYETKDNTAKAASGDYLTKSGALFFRAGRLVLSVDVLVVGDGHIEADESFFVRVSAPDGAIAPTFGTTTLVNDDRASSGLSGKIAFVSGVAGVNSIFSINANRTNRTRLTSGGDFSPAWSPDGQKIAFTSRRDGNDEIYVMNADGSGQTRLTRNSATDYSPAWSPDGKKIVFVSAFSRAGALYTMNPDGSGLQSLSVRGEMPGEGPKFAPDGRKIVFTDPYENPYMALIGADGNGFQALDIRVAGATSLDVNSPAYSPDGRKIAYSVAGHQDLNPKNHDFQIYAMNADGSAQTKLTKRVGDQNFSPCFSPDGAKIAFTSYRPGTPGRILIINPDGSGEQVFIEGAAPSWASGSVPTPKTTSQSAPAPSAASS